MLHSTTVSSEQEMNQILDLQRLYLRGRKGSEEENKEGFLTVEHSLDALKKMHRLQPGVIVKDDQVVAGYALVMPAECKDFIPELIPMFSTFRQLSFLGKPVAEQLFYVMGQICVSKPYRGQGIFDMLYAKHKELFHRKYQFVITEISTRNLRSLAAHTRVGFTNLLTYRDDLDEWTVAAWDWK
jgi:ribosomal protein S18 acetylase RimI-like enzyme